MSVVGTVDLGVVAPEIWEMMLGLALHDTDEVVAPSAGQRTITGLVGIVGDVVGAVTLETTTAGARWFAAAMFASDDPDALDLDEVRDAHAELTNMVGGNVKNLFPGVCRLGIPTVTEGIGYLVHLPRTAPVQVASYRCGDHVVTVTLHLTQ